MKIENYNFSGKKAVVRVDFNVPLDENFNVTDNSRIRAAIPTINKIAQTGAVILMSHLGRPKDGPDDKYSLRHIVPELNKLLGRDVIFIDDCIGENVEKKAAGLKQGDILLLENLRFYKEETKGEENFSKKLASLGDVYVNDAFGTAHRAHASTTIIANYFPNDKMFGYLIENELKSIDKMLHDAKKPFTAIMGGAKVSTKITLIDKMLSKVDNLIIGGGMTYTFVKAKGGKIGMSLVEDHSLDIIQEIEDNAKVLGVNLYLPTDSINADKFSNEARTEHTKIDNVSDGMMGLDIGEESIEKFSEVIKNSATILWNGPVGVFEMSNFDHGTRMIAEAVVEATKNGAFSLIGGGDTVSAIYKYGMEDKVSYVSTGGGALLEYIEGKELPGIKAIRG